MQFWIYLQGRTQTTQIDWYISARKDTTCGVPQGSVLSPLLFLIYIKAIKESSKKLKFFLFVDNTNILFANKNIRSLEPGTLQTVRLANGKEIDPEYRKDITRWRKI